MAATGGLIRNANGNQIAGFCANIGISSVTNAELWGLFYGLDLGWKLGIRSLLVEVDSKCIIDLLADDSNSPNNFSSVIQSIRRLINREWHVCISHIYHEANFATDFLTNLAIRQPLGFHFLHNPPSGVVNCLFNDMYGNAFPRFVSVQPCLAPFYIKKRKEKRRLGCFSNIPINKIITYTCLQLLRSRKLHAF